MEFTSIYNSIPYIILIVFLGILALTNNENKHIRNYIFIILLIFFGLRGFIGTDFINYYRLYDRLPEPANFLSWYLDKEYYEIGFFFYSTILKSMGAGYEVWVFINSLFDLVVLFWFLNKYSKYFYLSLCLFIIIGGQQFEFDLYRNGKACFIYLLAIPTIKSRSFWKYNILVLLAMSFHASAALLWPFYYIGRIYITKTFAILTYIIICAIYFLRLFPSSLIIENFFGGTEGAVIDKLNGYLESQGEGYGLTFGFIEKSIIFWICVLCYRKLSIQNPNNIMFCNAYFIYFALWYIFADITVFVQRFPLLYSFSYWIVIPNSINLANKSLKPILKMCVILFSILKASSLYSLAIYKYDNQLWGIESYNVRKNIIDNSGFYNI